MWGWRCRSFVLLLTMNKDKYRYAVRRLPDDVIPENCYHKVHLNSSKILHTINDITAQTCLAVISHVLNGYVIEDRTNIRITFADKEGSGRFVFKEGEIKVMGEGTCRKWHRNLRGRR